ncbi:hypothetical protein [Spirillospora albida]|uniref:hypothetical protein n=1 Tax=Spirillospora albida TaxID=58123 RepID=UPI0012FA5894|nr:hypothetical protein [Spirillospora albida]
MRAVRTSPSRFSHGALMLAAALALTACGPSPSASDGKLDPAGSAGDARPSPASTVAAPSAQPTEQLYKTVLDRYREYQAVYKRTYERNDPSELSTVAMEPLLSRLVKDVEKTKAKGEFWRFTNSLNPRVYAKSKDSTKIYVLDCVRTLAAYRFSSATGKRLGGGPGGAYVVRTTVQYDSGTWKVAELVQDRPC